ncbi:MAG: hypothetical protein EOO39_01235 [Cytophagaceae bacterium]|nr:MAG: hypothetical protein EOO39_01235 [Cytophagaceae bacterium]
MPLRYLIIAVLGVISRFALAQTTCQAPQYTYTNTPGSRSVSVSWSYYGNGSPTYQVQYRFSGQAGWTTNGISSSSSTLLSNLAPNTGYEWRVRTICAARDTSVFTAPLSFSTACAMPQYLYTGTITYESAQVNWSSSSNESPAYQVQYRVAGATNWTSRPIQSGTYGSLTNLSNDTDYQWRVRSICSPGDTSAFSSPSSFKTVCYTPLNLYTNDVTYQSARLTWYGGTYGASYEVYWRPAGAANWTSALSSTNTFLVLTGLTNETSYEWKVRTICSVTAMSAFSSPVIFRTNCSQPYSPITSIVAVDGAELRWTNPYGVYTSDVRWRAAGSANWTDVPNLNSADYGLSMLAPNTTYEWQVRAACSATDKSAYIGSTLFTTSCTVPLNPGTSGIGYNQATLTWTAKSSANLQYRAAGSANWATLTNVTSPYALTGLSVNVIYEWRVATACTEGITSDYTSTQLFTTRCNAPMYTESRMNGTSDGFQCIWYGLETGAVYEVQWRVAGSTTWTVVPGVTQGQYTISPITFNTTYEWRVRRACTATDFSDFTPTATYTPVCPSAYPSYFYQKTTTSGELNWSSNGAASGTYEIQWRVTGSANWATVTGLTTSPYTLTGLVSGVAYEWRVRRLCTPPTGSDFSSSSSFTLQCNQPSYFSANAISTTTASLNWYGNSSIYPPYDVNYRPVGQSTWLSLTNLPTSAVSLSGLTPNTTYEWQVRANCSTGNTPFGATQTFLPQCGGPQTNLAVESYSGIGEVKVRWDGQTGPASYEIQYRETGTTAWLTKLVPAAEIEQSSVPGSGLKRYTFYGLTVGRTYEWRVKAICENVSSFYFDGPAFNTNCRFDGFLSSGYQPDNSRFVVTWNTLASTDTYEVQWRPQGTPTWLTEQGITGSAFIFTNLQPGLIYEYTVQRVCSAASKSAILNNNQIMRYQTPSSVQITARSGNSINVNWTYQSATAEELTRTAFTIQYRVSGTGSWTLVNVPANSAISQYPALSFPLTGLATGVSYEVQIRAEYSPQIISDYSYSTYYTLSCPSVYSPQTVVGTSSARLSWYANASGTAAQLQWRQAGSQVWTTVSVPGFAYGTAPFYLLTGLAANITYEWRVATDCGGGFLSAFTEVQSFMTGCTLSTASTLYTTGVNATSANLNWSYYTGFLGTSIVQYRPLNSVTWMDVDAQTRTSLPLTGLAVNTVYEARIRSVCQGGQAWVVSSTTQFQTACRGISNSSASSIQARSARLIWTADAPVTIQWRQFGTTIWSEVAGATSPYDLSGLTPNTSYEIRFQTVCSPTSVSPYSDVYVFTTASLNASSLNVQVGNTGMQEATLYVTSPGNAAYRVQWRVAGATNWVNSGLLTGSSYLLQNLTPGTAYEARVEQPGGGSPVYSYVVQFNTYCPQLTSTAVTTVAAQAAILSWYINKPGPVQVQWRTGGATSWITTTFPASGGPFSLTGLIPATSYEWRAAPACNGLSPVYSPVNTFRTPALCQAPADPYSYNVNPSSATLSWYAYSMPAQFTIRYRPAGTTTWFTKTATNSPFVLTGLANNTTYDWGIGVDCGPGTPMTFSTTTRFTTYCAPLYLGSVQVTPTKAHLTWSSGGSDYVARWRVQGTTNWTTTPVTTPSLILTGLTPNTSYEWQVRNGCSPEVNASYVNGYPFTTQCSSASPSQLVAKTVGANAVTLSWRFDAYTNTNVDLNQYTVGWRVQGTTTWTTQAGLTSPYTLTGLATNTTYEWQVRTDCNPLFDSPYTFQTNCTLPVNQRVDQQTNSTARLVWNDDIGDGPYEVQWRVAGTDTWNTMSGVAGTAYTLTGLTNNTDYEWQVRGMCGGPAYTTVAFRLTSERQTSIYTVKTGLWNDATVWSCNCIPATTDAVLIKHTVRIPASYTGYTKRIFYEGAGQLQLSGASVVKPIP